MKPIHREDIERIEAAVRTLREFFDTVHIFATSHENDEDGTVHFSTGAGNWFARYGHIERWLKRQDHYEQRDINKLDDDEDL